MKYNTRILSLLLLSAALFILFLFLFAFSSEVESSPYGRNRRKRCCILVPFRDRWEELLQFVPHMSGFLDNSGIRYGIFVLQQRDSWRFNRASLFNAGVSNTLEDCDYYGLHDVDLLPLNPHLSYEYPQRGPMHLSAPGLHPKYDYPAFVGGILLLKKEDFLKARGMSNNYWGWGLEDDEFHARIIEASLTLQRPIGIKTGKSDTFLHIHGSENHSRRDRRNCFNQKEVTGYRDRTGGIDTVDYALKAKREMKVDNYPFTLLDIELHCDKEKTPWCTCKGAPQNERKKFKIDEKRRKDLILPIVPKRARNVEN